MQKVLRPRPRPSALTPDNELPSAQTADLLTHLTHTCCVYHALCRRHADPSAVDAAGNTPGHLAAMHGHVVLLSELIKASYASCKSLDLEQ